MRIAVVGLGGVGGYIAANLAKTSHEIVGFARGEHLAKIQKEGITIVEDDNTWHVEMEATTLKKAEGHFDIVLFCVKSYDLKSSYEAIRTHLDSDTIILSLANGVEHADVLRAISDCKVLDGCVYILSHQESPGVIRKMGNVFALVFGGLREEAKVLKSVFDAASLRAKIEEDIQKAIWKKYIFICAFATATSFYDKTIGSVYEKHFEEVRALLSEIAELAHAKNIEIQEEVQKALDIAKSLPYESSTSMHLDFKNKKRDELETLTGYVVREGKKSGVATPLMQKMYEALLLKHL